MLRKQENQKGNEYREFHIRRNDLWIEVVGFHRVDYDGHDGDHEEQVTPTIIESDKRDRYRGNQESEYRNESHYEYEDSNRGNEWKTVSAVDIPDDDESENREYRVNECNDRLRLENESESIGNLFREIGELFVNKSKTAVFDAGEVTENLFPVNQEYEAEQERDHNLEEEYSRIFDVLEYAHEGAFDIRLTYHPIEKLVESEIETHLALQIVRRTTKLVRNLWRELDEPLGFLDQVRNETVEHRDNTRDENEVDNRNDDREFVAGCQYFSDFWRMDLCRELGQFFPQPLREVHEQEREEKREEKDEQE